MPGDPAAVHQTDANNATLEPANTEQRVQVSRADLPLSCPMPDEKLWNSHPRVYLPIEETGEAACPYCGAQYQLAE